MNVISKQVIMSSETKTLVSSRFVILRFVLWEECFNLLLDQFLLQIIILAKYLIYITQLAIYMEITVS